MIKKLLLLFICISCNIAYCMKLEDQLNKLKEEISSSNPSITKDEVDLLWSTSKNNIGRVAYLVRKKRVKVDCNFFVTNPIYEGFATPLYYAVKNGNLSMVNFLLKNKACPNGLPWARFTTLHLAAMCGHTKIAQRLLEYGATIDAQGRYDETPLYYAVREDNESMVELLLLYGANSQANFYEMTDLGYSKEKMETNILHFANTKKNLNIIKMLKNASV